MCQIGWALVFYLVVTSACAQSMAPRGAIFSSERIQNEYQPPRQMTEKGFHFLLGWINVATTTPSLESGQVATVEIREFKILERSTNGRVRTVQEVKFDGSGNEAFAGELWNRLPYWFMSGQPGRQLTVANIIGGNLLVDMKKAATSVFHGWVEPRIRANPGRVYLIEATIRVKGAARIQFGIDFWASETAGNTGWSHGCMESMKCEAWLSEWFGPTNGRFQTVVVPGSLR